MKPPVETIRLGKQSKDQLIKIKRITGIENWNIICRWAFCVSMREPTPPPKSQVSSEGGVEIPWRVFAGEQSTHFCAVLKLNDTNSKGVLLNSHIQRGLGSLASNKGLKNIENLIERIL